MEYRQFYFSVLGGYVVYRHFFDTAKKATVFEMAKAHRVATFVDESAGLEYCAWMNKQILNTK